MQHLPLGQQQPSYPQPQHAWHAASPSGPATTPTTVWRAIDSLGTRLEATQICIVPLFVPSWRSQSADPPLQWLHLNGNPDAGSLHRGKHSTRDIEAITFGNKHFKFLNVICVYLRCGSASRTVVPVSASLPPTVWKETHMWCVHGPRVETEHYSTTYFDRVTTSKAL